MKISEIFPSIQGEGTSQGYPVLFIRTSGCTRNCDFCDTKYHKEGKELSVKEVVAQINKSNLDTVVWTGGEPLLQIKEIEEVIYSTNKLYDLETNGDLILTKKYLNDLNVLFDYICVSPKSLEVAKRIHSFSLSFNLDIKVVTDLDKVNVNLIKYATTLMPLTTNGKKETNLIQRRVWNYCVNHNLFYSARMHVNVWGVIKKGK